MSRVEVVYTSVAAAADWLLNKRRWLCKESGDLFGAADGEDSCNGGFQSLGRGEWINSVGSVVTEVQTLTAKAEAKPEAESSGGSVDYYKCPVQNPTTDGVEPYIAECNDIIEALGMTYAEANVFKAIWRSCAERTLGLAKAGNDAIRDAEKMVFFSDRVLKQREIRNG